MYRHVNYTIKYEQGISETQQQDTNYKSKLFNNQFFEPSVISFSLPEEELNVSKYCLSNNKNLYLVSCLLFEAVPSHVF